MEHMFCNLFMPTWNEEFEKASQIHALSFQMELKNLKASQAQASLSLPVSRPTMQEKRQKAKPWDTELLH